MKSPKINIHPSVDRDKHEHIIIGIMIFVVSTALCLICYPDDLWIALATTLSAGILKELYDRYIKKNKDRRVFDWMDAFATTGVATCFYVVIKLVMYVV